MLKLQLTNMLRLRQSKSIKLATFALTCLCYSMPMCIVVISLVNFFSTIMFAQKTFWYGSEPDFPSKGFLVRSSLRSGKRCKD